MSRIPGWGGWHTEMQGDCEYHIATVAGGARAAYVTQDEDGEWVAGVYDTRGFGYSEVIGSGYASLYEAKRACDAARNE